MSFWSGEKLGVKLPTLVDPYDSAKVDCAAYKKLGSGLDYKKLGSGLDYCLSSTRRDLPPEVKTRSLSGWIFQTV
jgi:hypothetical protein